MRKVCVITGSRAEYGLLSNLMKQIQNSPKLKLQIIATNMHLSPEFGLTYREIEKDGFVIDKFVEMLLSSDTPASTSKSVGLGVIGFADAYKDLSPDMLVVLGDRYEILSAVSSALFFKIPVVHIHGGEITEGAYDDSIRHAITKMSHIHFTSTETYRNRVIQLGESPDRVFNVGALGIENIKMENFIPKADLENELDFTFTDKCLLVTFHPVTLDACSAQQQIENLFVALDNFPAYKVLFTMPNSDTGGRVIIESIERYVARNKTRMKAFTSLGRRRYLSALGCVSAAVGNSSSGIIEVPSFGIPTLDIGIRQKGRVFAPSVVHSDVTSDAIKEGLRKVLSEEQQQIAGKKLNPYEKEGTIRSIISIMENCDLTHIVQKKFYDL